MLGNEQLFSRNGLKPPAGAALLKALGVEGTQDELEDASRSVRGHGLALTLLGTYLSKVHGGDVRKIGEVELSKADERQGGHARKLMEKYERWLGEGAELSILRLLGLFDRPAEAASLAAVRAAPAIAGLTDSLVDVSEEDWNWAVSNLREYGLVAKEAFENDNSLDAHPLVREHFAAQLTAEQPEATREGHRRLYEHLKQSAPELPDTLQEMMPLYHAVAHGCKAGLGQNARTVVFRDRILRGREFYAWRKLGAFGASLAALSEFYAAPWSQLRSTIDKQAGSFISNWAGACLRATGRMAESAQPMKAGIDSDISDGKWEYAALNASNLSELYVTLGDVSAAVRAAEQSVELADHSGAFNRKTRRARLASALHQSARLRQSQVAFREAEAMQAEWRREYPLLNTMSGFQYCDLLLEEVSRILGPLSFAWSATDGPQIEAALRNCHEVRRRAETTLEWVSRAAQDILSIALDHLTLGRTCLLEGHVSRTEGR